MIKPEARVIAWDDCAFGLDDMEVRIVGPIFRGGRFMDGMLSVKIKKDGFDSTDRMADSIINSRHYDQLSYIMLDGISFAGLNIADIKRLNKMTKLPAIAVMRKWPDVKGFVRAISSIKGCESRLIALSNAGTIYTHGGIFYQKAGVTVKECEELIEMTCTQSNLPEPLRIAHIIASGLSRARLPGFESRGRA